MDVLLAKIFATALVFSQVATTPSQLRTQFDEVQDQPVVSDLLRSGCSHMRKAFDIEALSLDDLIATAMEDADTLSSDQVLLRGMDLKELHVAYRQFCKNEDISGSSIDLGQVIRFYNETLTSLPSSIDLSELKPPGMTAVLDSSGQLFQQKRRWVAIEQVPLQVQQAFIAAEDKGFHEHHGIDERALVRAFIANFARSGRMQGGSTITQQVVKTLLVGPEVSYERKMREMVLAARLEGAIPKNKILELYLNSIYLGRGSWGIEMASRNYLGKSVIDLDVADAAMLASLAKGPAFYNPERYPDRSRERTAYVLNRMHEDRFIDSTSLNAAMTSLPLALVTYQGSPQGSHFGDYIAREGKLVANMDLAASGDYTVQATVHPHIQNAAEAALQDGLSRYERSAGRVDFQGAETSLADDVARVNSAGGDAKPAWQVALQSARLPLQDLHWPAAIVTEKSASGTIKVGLVDGQTLPLSLPRGASSKLKMYDVVRVQLSEGKGKAIRAELRVPTTVQGAVVVLENQTGRILAMAGGFSYSLSQLNRVTQSYRQPGSSLKPLVYLAALQRGLQPNTLIRDDAVSFPPIGASPRARVGDTWTPKNYDGREGGIITLRQALEASKNLATARLLEGIDDSPPQSLDQVCRLAQDLKLYKDCIRYYPFVLGAQPVRPIDLAVFYATIANEGLRPVPYAIESISRQGKVDYRHDPALEQVALADPPSFYQLKTMLQGVVARGTGRSLSHMAPYIAGKTGTTDGENDVWFVGFSNEVTVAVWVGYDNADGNRRTLGSGRTGGNLATSVFEPIMQAVWTHHSPKTALRLPSPEAQRSLAAVSKGYGKTSKGLLPELLRRDARGRTLDAQYRLVSRSEHDVYVAAKVARSQAPEENSSVPPNGPDGRNGSWFGGGGWGDWPRWENNDDGRRRGGRW